MLQKHLRFLLTLLYLALGFGAAVLLLPGLLPFLLGWGLSCLLDPSVRFLNQKTGLRRSWVSAVILLLFIALLAAGGFLLFRRLWYELSLLSSKLPLLVQLLQSLSQKAENLVYRWTVAVSPQLRTMVQQLLEQAMQRIGELASSLGSRGLAWCAKGITALPGIALFLLVSLLSGYFFLADRTSLTGFFRRLIPARWLSRLDNVVTCLKGALGGWARTQGILMGITALLLTAGFFLMGVEPAVLLAAGIALLDALPVFGTGTVLIPWALFSLISGNYRRGGTLLILYAILWLVRSLLEPKLIADRAGLHPLAALFAMYLGFTLFGVAGMLLAPLGAVLLRQLYAGGLLNLREK